jgi:hypothetical protein
MKSAAFLAGLLLSLAGCAYHVGPVRPVTHRSVAVPMFKNQTLKPQLQAQVTNAIIKRLQADGTLRLEWEQDAEVVVTGTITRYGRAVQRWHRIDVEKPREYRLELEAVVAAHDRATGKVLLPPTTLTGKADAFIGSDLQGAEQQALPLMADDLARQVVSLLVERW